MTTSTTLRPRMPALPAVLLAGAIILTGAACAAVGVGPTTPPTAPPASPVSTPIPSPAITAVPATPSAVPTAKPTPVETDPGSDGMPITVNLENATHHKVYVDIVDQSGRVLSGTSGHPGDGATVAPLTLKVENVDARTLRLTWVDIPGDNALGLYIDKTLTHFVMVQPEHDGDTIPFDRILILKFSQPVSARYIQAVLQNGTDTVG
jgi:hypothetical protein